jgi:glycosyltransferase involved in cell wall biosynthesis
MLPIISVIIPLYNKGKYIKRSIQSVLNQSVTNFELIIVDDGSTDDGSLQAKSIIDNRISIISQHNSGPGSARNTGLRYARANFVAFLDADDEWLPDFLKNGLEIFEKNPNLASVTQGYFLNSVESSPRDYWLKHGIREGIIRVTSDTLAHNVISLLAFMSPCSTIIKKAIAVKYGGFFDTYKCLYAEDAYLMLNILMNEEIFIDIAPQVIFHTLASDLTNFKGRPHEIEPFFKDSNKIISNCPVEKRLVLRQTLAIRALRTAHHYALFGNGSVAKDLLSKYKVSNFMEKEWLITYTLAQIAPILPVTRKYYRIMRNLLHV